MPRVGEAPPADAGSRRGIPWKYAVLGLGPLLAVAILARVDLGAVGRSLRQADPLLLLVAVLLNGVLVQIRGLRWHYLVRAQGISVTPGDAFLVNYASFAIAFFTPGRVGDLARGLHLIDLGHSYVKSFLSVVYERVMDLAVVVLIGMLGIRAFADLFPGTDALPLALVALAFAGGVFLFLRVGGLRRMGYAVLRRVSPTLATTGGEEMADGFHRMTPLRDLVALLFTLAMWGTYFLQGWVLARALGIPIGYLHVAAIICIAALLMMVPISVAGIGTRDAVFVSAFWRLGLPASEAIAFSVLILGTQIVHVVIGYLLWARRPSVIRFPSRGIAR